MNNATLLATQGSDFEATRSSIASSVFLSFGVVVGVVDVTHVDVKLWYLEDFREPTVLKNVELMKLGGSTLSVEVPAVSGDLVALFGAMHPVSELVASAIEDKFCTSGQAYTWGTVKALQIGDSSVTPKGSLVVESDGSVVINGKLKVLP